MELKSPVILVTGGTSGIGLGLCDRLLRECRNANLCLTCRSVNRGNNTRTNLLAEHPGAKVSLIEMDMCDLKSVYRGISEIKRRFKRIDYLFMNAGYMGKTHLDYGYFFKTLFTREAINMLSTAHGLLTQTDFLTKDGISTVFSTNVFSHFILVKHLEEMMGGNQTSTQIIWTGSTNAQSQAFDINDIQHRHGKTPYSSSKQATDLLSLALNKRLNSKNIYSHVVSPGTVITNMTSSIMPSWIWQLSWPILYLMRALVPAMTVTPHNACEAMMWLTRQEAYTLDPSVKYHSLVSVFGTNYVDEEKLELDEDLAEELLDKLTKMEEAMIKDKPELVELL